MKTKLSFVPQPTSRSTTTVASDTKEPSTEKSSNVATNQPGTTGVPVETKSIEATVAPVTVDARPATSNFPPVIATTPVGTEELADNTTTTKHSISRNQTEISTPDEIYTTAIVNATEQPEFNQTEKISSTAQPALGPVLPDESGIPKDAVVPREEIDAQTERIQPTPLATVQPIKESNDSMSTQTNVNTTSTSQTTEGGTAQPDKDSLSNLQGPVLEQKAKNESEDDYPSFGSNGGPISPGDQGGLDPEDQGRLNPEDQGELNPKEEGDNVPIDQGGITPRNQGDPEDQDRLNPGFNQPTKRFDHSNEDYGNDLDHL